MDLRALVMPNTPLGLREQAGNASESELWIRSNQERLGTLHIRRKFTCQHKRRTGVERFFQSGVVRREDNVSVSGGLDARNSSHFRCSIAFENCAAMLRNVLGRVD